MVHIKKILKTKEKDYVYLKTQTINLSLVD